MKKRNYILAAMMLSFAPPALAMHSDKPIRLGDSTQTVDNDAKACAWDPMLTKAKALQRKVDNQRREADEAGKATVAPAT